MRAPGLWLVAGLGGLLAAQSAIAGTPATPDEARLETAVVDFFAREAGVTLRPDEPLRAVASENSEILASTGGTVAPEFLAQASSAHGLLDPFPYVFYGSTPSERLDEIERRLLDALGGISPTEARLYTHVAVGIRVRRRRRFRIGEEHVCYVTAILVQRALSFSPWPPEARPGERFLFEGEVHAPFREPQLLLTCPDGSTTRVADLALEPQRFRAYVAFDHGPGEYQLEIMGRYDMGPRVLGLCTLQARSQVEPTPYETVLAAARAGTLERPTPRSRPAPGSERQAETVLLRLVNRDRERFGLAPLEEAPELSALARAHASDMRDHAFFAHVSPRTGSLAERAQVAGIHYRRLAENIAVDRDVEAAEAALLHSPGHRLNLLSPDFTRVGIGVAFESPAGGEPRVFVTQNFALPAP